MGGERVWVQMREREAKDTLKEGEIKGKGQQIFLSSTMRRMLLLMVLFALLFQETDGKRKGSSKKIKIKEPSVVKKIKKALDPIGILNSNKEKSGTRDLAKITEDGIVNEHLRLSTQVMNWLNKVVDVGKGIANGVCRTVKLL